MVKMLVCSAQQQNKGCRAVFVSQQEELVDTIEPVNVNAREIVFLRFTNHWIANNICNGLINDMLLVVVKLFIRLAR